MFEGEQGGPSVEAAFGQGFDEFKRRMADKTLNIVVVGAVSSGKSSLINAVLGCERNKPAALVGAESGVTKGPEFYALGPGVCVADTPGMGDIVHKNSEKTRAFLRDVQIGIFVVTGSADVAQKAVFAELKKYAKRVFVVLNKCDVWDELEDSALDAVLVQWKLALEVSTIYPTCTKGYDPRYRKDAPMKVVGVDALRDDILAFLESRDGEDLLLRSVMKDKAATVGHIIAGACAAVAAAAFAPLPGGSSVAITGAQATAIAGIYFVYTGRLLPKSSALALVPAFLGQAIGHAAFLALESLLPTTIVVDIAAAGVAVAVTLPMLLAVNSVLETGATLENREALRASFAKYRRTVPQALGAPSMAWTTRTFWEGLIGRLMAM